jgi:hypothetical protein
MIGHTARASNQTESERKTLEAGLKSMPQGSTATLDQFADCQGEGLNFRSARPAACATEAVRIWTKHPKIAQCEG